MTVPYETVIAVRAVAITTNGWTDIVGLAVLPIDCNTIVIYNNTGQTIFYRSDPGNANSQVSILNGQQFTIGSPYAPSGRGPRFPAGSGNPAGSLQASASGVSPIIESIA